MTEEIKKREDDDTREIGELEPDNDGDIIEDVDGENIRVTTIYEPGYDQLELMHRISRKMLKYREEQALPLCEFLTNDLLLSFIQWTEENACN